jgi:hypothetical protein
MSKYTIIVDQAINPIPQLGVHARRSWNFHGPFTIARWGEPKLKTLKKR